MSDTCLQTIAYKELSPDIGRKGTQMPAEITSRKSQCPAQSPQRI